VGIVEIHIHYLKKKCIVDIFLCRYSYAVYFDIGEYSISGVLFSPDVM